VKADPNAQLRLLDLQAVDSEADQLRHRLGHLAEESVIKELTAERGRVLGQLRDQQIVVDDLTAAQQKADADVEQVKARHKRDRDRMDAGLIANPKDLERMQHELETLQRRISVLEDEELEVMEQLEDAQSTLTALQQQIVEIDDKLEVVTAARDKQAGEINAELTVMSTRRDPLVTEIPEDLLALYERLRGQKGGVGAAALRARQCGGCMLTLDPAELARVRSLPEDEVVRCEECQRILVRTAESGL
jgi:predicted  nucleic acid-binding Zn-ribbon protein